MTFFALGLVVAAGELKARLGMVVGRILPEFFVVATFTFVAKLAIMLVILLVAGNALGFQLFLVNRPSCRQVAVVALRLHVLVFQPILGIAIMVKGDRFPRFFGMTSLALVAIALFVPFFLIVLLVAGYALAFQLFLVNQSFCRQVAVVTLWLQMFVQ